MSRRLVKVAAGMVLKGGKVLVARKAPHKSNAGLWEFPGGKLEPGETLAFCIQRELEEELGLNVEVLTPLGESKIRLVQYDLVLLGVLCRTGDEVSKLVDHDETQWLHPDEVNDIPLVPADRPLLKALLAYVKEQEMPSQA